MDEKEELENLKRLLFKAVKGEDVDLIATITDYMEGFCKIKHDCFAETIKVGFEEVKKLITDNHLDTTNNLDMLKRELGLNGYSKKG